VTPQEMVASQFRLLFTPIRIGSAEAKNRIVSTSHDAHFDFSPPQTRCESA